MSVVGLDVGNENCLVGVARQRGIDVILNDESNRETPAMVSFSDKQRFLGTAAAATATMNPKNTISQIKRLIGRKFRDPEVQEDLLLFPFAVTEGPDGSPLINVQYLNERTTFTPTQILGMILYNLKCLAEKALGSTVVDCVVGIPVYFSELQRRGYMDAATIAGLRPLRLMHETTAAALAYGIYKADLPGDEPLNVVFVDVGHASMQVCVTAFKKGQLKVLGQSFDRSLGGRDFDQVLFNHFTEKFKQEYRIDVLSNARASQRLRAACEKMKKVLSANAQALLNIECLLDEKDVRGHIKREEFEQLAATVLERVRIPCERALADANLSVDKIGAIEVIGSGSRVPAVLKIIASYFGKEPSHTLNASECVARGCTLQCAMLSPTFRVRDYEVQDCFPFPIALAWKGPVSQMEGGETTPNSIVFVKGNPLPSAKLLTFYRLGTFYIDALYADTNLLPAGMASKISTYQIGPFTPLKPERAMLKVKIRLNLHGILSLELATLIEEDESEGPGMKPTDSPREPRDAVPVETDIPRSRCQVDGKDSNLDNGESFRPNLPYYSGAENTVPGPESMLNKMETEQIQSELAITRKMKKTDVPIHETVLGGFPNHELQKAVEKEYEMACQDRIMEETKDKKNAVETYVYEMRNMLSEILQEFTTEREREELTAKLQQTEFWLYEEGEDETKGVYVSKLAELRKLGDPFLERQREDEARGPATTELLHCIDSYREAATLKDAKYDHISTSDKEKVIIECKKVEDWLKVKKQQQDGCAKTTTPVLCAADIKAKVESLDLVCKPIMTKPRPSPPLSSTSPKGRERNDSHDGASYAYPPTKEDQVPCGPQETKKPSGEEEMMQTD